MDPLALWPAAPVAALLTGLLLLRARSPAWERAARLALPLSVALLFLLGWRGLYGSWPALWPAERSSAKGWILPGLWVVAVAGILPPWSRPHGGGPHGGKTQLFLAWVASELVVGAGHALSLSHLEQGALVWELGMQAALILYVVSLGEAGRRPGWEPPFYLLAGLVAAAVVVGRGGWAQGALLLAAVGMVPGAALLSGLAPRLFPGWIQEGRAAPAYLAGAGGGIALASGGVLLVGLRLAEASLGATLAAALLPQLLWLGPSKGWGGRLLRSSSALVLLYLAFRLSWVEPGLYG